MKARLTYINRQHLLYPQAVNLRIECFFKEMKNALRLINDSNKGQAIHLVYVTTSQEVVGTGRLHTKETTAYISQMAVSPKFQQQGVG